MTTNLTRDEAQSRSELLRIKTYAVAIDVGNAETDDATYTSSSTVEMKAKRAATTFIDFIADSVSRVTINGEELDPAEVFDGARVTFPVVEGRNELTVVGQARYSTSGEGMHRFTDPADGKTYLYTQYEPTDARRVFANFDQPDLKAKFSFTVTAPEDFQVLTNRAQVGLRFSDPEPREDGVRLGRAATHVFEPTLKQSSYITCITAGPYEGATDEWVDPHTGETVPLGAWTRASLVDHLDASDIFSITKAGLEFFTTEFDSPYPWGKYDQIFVPEYNLGAMENPGLVTFTDSLIFKDKVTDAMYESRANVILHEMAHMWFGDLVTMKWWDDLWLKESFADYMGGLALAEATRFTDGWVTFALRRKAWAYKQDQYPTTHPIVADIPDVEAAKLNFDGITYAKGASVLKQLVAYVGRQAFFAGSRRYFERFAYRNTELADFLDCLAEAAPDRDIAGWASAWLGTSGVSELTLDLTTSDSGVITEATISQSDSAGGRSLLRPHTLEIATLGRKGREIVPIDTVRLDFSDRTVPVEQLVGRSRGDIALLNYADHDYAKVRLDEGSTDAAVRAVSRISDPLSRALTWSALENAVRDGLLPVQRYLTAYARSLGKESHAGIMAGLSQTALQCIDSWVSTRNVDAAITGLLGAALDALATARPGSDAQLHLANLVLALTSRTARCFSTSPAISGGRAFAAHILTVPVGEEIERLSSDAGNDGSDDGAGALGTVASPVGTGTSRGTSTMPDHAARPLPFRGLINDHALRWNALTALVCLGWADQTDIAREVHADPSSSGRIHAETASAALPLPIVKIRVWEIIQNADELSNAVLSAIIAGFVAPSPVPLIEDYVDVYFAKLTEFWAENSIEIARRLVLGLYPKWSVDEERVVELSDAWLAKHADAPGALRRLLIESRDDLARAIYLKSTQSSRH